MMSFINKFIRNLDTLYSFCSNFHFFVLEKENSSRFIVEVTIKRVKYITKQLINTKSYIDFKIVKISTFSQWRYETWKKLLVNLSLQEFHRVQLWVVNLITLSLLHTSFLTLRLLFEFHLLISLTLSFCTQNRGHLNRVPPLKTAVFSWNISICDNLLVLCDGCRSCVICHRYRPTGWTLFLHLFNSTTGVNV